jgi:hypothetical protein
VALITEELLRTNLVPKLEAQIKINKKIKKFITLEETMLVIPPKSSPEHAKIAEYAKTPWAKKLVKTRVTRLHVAGIRDTSGSNDSIWASWKNWRMISKEKAIYFDAITYGESFVEIRKVLGNKTIPIVKNPFSFTAFYGLSEFSDPLNAEFPDLAMEKMDDDTYRVWDESNIYDWKRPEGSSSFILVKTTPHGAKVVPFIRYANDTNSSGQSVGEIKPLISLLLRIQKAAYDSGLINHNNSWNIRYATGLSSITDEPRLEGETDEEYEARLAMMETRLRQELNSSDLLTSTNENAKFGSLPATNPGAFVTVIESLLKELAAVSDTPSDYLTGNAIQQTAEQAANSNASFNAIMDSYREVFGESHEALIRLAASMTGSTATFTGIAWQDSDTGSIAAKVDAYGKMAATLRVPPRVLWNELPNMTPEKLQSWFEAADELQKAEQRTMLTMAGIGLDNEVTE